MVKKKFFSKFNQIWFVSNLHQWHMQWHNFLGPHPLGPWGGPKSISKIFKPNCVCLLTIERYKTYQTGFSFRCLGRAPGVGRGGLGGPKLFIPKSNQIWCVSYLNEWHMQRHNFFGPSLMGPWGGAKRSNIIKSQLQSQFQRFLI